MMFLPEMRTQLVIHNNNSPLRQAAPLEAVSARSDDDRATASIWSADYCLVTSTRFGECSVVVGLHSGTSLGTD